MGANYDLIISSAEDERAFVTRVEAFLSQHGFDDVSTSALDAVEIDNASAVLVSPAFNQHIQVVAENRSLGVPLAEWFEQNCFASALSDSGKVSFHLWSLDSGFVAGYSAFENGTKVEANVAFSKHVRNTKQLMDGVPTPRTIPGNVLGTRIGSKRFDFSTHMHEARSFEIGFGDIISKFGFDVHLVDFFEALDEQEGIAIVNGEYHSVTLKQWTAIRFAKR